MSTLRKDGPAPADSLAESGQRLYDERLKALLEPRHEGELVTIDPDSECYFLGTTSLAALHAGRKMLPNKLFHLLRVGHEAAYRVGGYGARMGLASTPAARLGCGSGPRAGRHSTA